MADLISRAAAIAEIEEFIEEYSELEPETGYHNLKWCAMEEAKDVLTMLPAVDAAPVVHGRWVDEGGNPVPWCDALPSSPAFGCWCSQCGTWLVASDEYPVYGLFCPACGAKMDGELEG